MKLKMLGKILLLLFLLAPLVSCKGLTVASVDRLDALAHGAGYMLGYIVGGKADDGLEARVADYYDQIRKDGLTVDLVNAGFLFLSETLKVNPGLIAELTYVLGELGAEFDANGKVINIRQVPAEYFDAAAAGYRNGLWAARWDLKHSYFIDDDTIIADSRYFGRAAFYRRE
jgi:hypothetical protein